MTYRAYPLDLAFKDHGSDFERYGSASVSANNQRILFNYRIPIDKVAFIDAVACNYAPSCHTHLEVDHILKRFSFEAAPVNAPRRYDPPLVALKRIKFTAINEDSSTHSIEGLVGGVLYDKSVLKSLSERHRASLKAINTLNLNVQELQRISKEGNKILRRTSTLTKRSRDLLRDIKLRTTKKK